MLKSSDTVFLKKHQVTEVSEHMWNRSTTKPRIFFTAFFGTCILESILCLYVCSLHTWDLHHVKQKLGMEEVSKMPRHELIGVPAHNGETQVPSWTCSDRTFSDRTFSTLVPLATFREHKVEDDFQWFWWMEKWATGGELCGVFNG